MRYLLLLLSISIIYTAFGQNDPDIDFCSRVHYSFNSASYLSVKGSSNVNSFTCINEKQLRGYEVILCGSSGNGYLEFLDAQLRIPVLDLDCGGRGINSDFRDMMDVGKYPDITLSIWTLERIQNSGQTQKYMATTSIKMKGKTRPQKIPVTLTKKGSNNYHVTGKVSLLLSDFGIETPKPLMGLIRVNDQVEINFNLDISYGL